MLKYDSVKNNEKIISKVAGIALLTMIHVGILKEMNTFKHVSSTDIVKDLLSKIIKR